MYIWTYLPFSVVCPEAVHWYQYDRWLLKVVIGALRFIFMSSGFRLSSHCDHDDQQNHQTQAKLRTNNICMLIIASSLYTRSNLSADVYLRTVDKEVKLFTERIACINFQELGAFQANIHINTMYNICKYNYHTYILLKMYQTLSYLRLKLW